MSRQIEISGVNMRAIAEAKASHHKTCAAPAWGVAMHEIAIERCGWEEGEEIVGLKPDAASASAMPGDHRVGERLAHREQHPWGGRVLEARDRRLRRQPAAHNSRGDRGSESPDPRGC